MSGRRMGIAAASVLGGLAFMGAAPGAASAASCSHDITSGETFLNGGGPSIWGPTIHAEIEDAGVFTGAQGRFDAFDGFGSPNVFGDDYSNPDEEGCSFESGGRELVYPVDTSVTDLTMRPKIFVSPRKPFARLLLTVRNTGASETAVIFGFSGDLGSDSDTTVFRTSSGDTTVGENDRWAVSCEDLDEDGCANTAGEPARDPEIAHIFQARNNGQLDGVALSDGGEDVSADYAGILVGPGEAKSVMYVVHLAATPRAAVRAAKAIDRDPAGYGVFQGMSKNERRFTRNF